MAVPRTTLLCIGLTLYTFVAYVGYSCIIVSNRHAFIPRFTQVVQLLIGQIPWHMAMLLIAFASDATSGIKTFVWIRCQFVTLIGALAIWRIANWITKLYPEPHHVGNTPVFLLLPFMLLMYVTGNMMAAITYVQHLGRASVRQLPHKRLMACCIDINIVVWAYAMGLLVLGLDSPQQRFMMVRLWPFILLLLLCEFVILATLIACVIFYASSYHVSQFSEFMATYQNNMREVTRPIGIKILVWLCSIPWILLTDIAWLLLEGHNRIDLASYIYAVLLVGVVPFCAVHIWCYNHPHSTAKRSVQVFGNWRLCVTIYLVVVYSLYNSNPVHALHAIFFLTVADTLVTVLSTLD